MAPIQFMLIREHQDDKVYTYIGATELVKHPGAWGVEPLQVLSWSSWLFRSK